jgi:hypothetical protein
VPASAPTSYAAAPHLAALRALLHRAHQLPLHLPTHLPQLKVDLAAEWTLRLHKLFTNAPLTAPDAGSPLLDILTPRLDIGSLLAKLQSATGPKGGDAKRAKSKQASRTACSEGGN